MSDQEENPYAPPKTPAEPPRNAFGSNVTLARLLVFATLAIIVLLAVLWLLA